MLPFKFQNGYRSFPICEWEEKGLPSQSLCEEIDNWYSLLIVGVLRWFRQSPFPWENALSGDFYMLCSLVEDILAGYMDSILILT